jgi:melibiose permease/lactose/raffinose/galactose permease
MLVIAALAFFSQLPVFLKFVDETGADLHSLVNRFSSTGYLVTIICVILAIAICASLLFRYKMFAQGREKVLGIWEGISSLRHVERPWLYWFYSVGIWVGYFLHFYLAFFCFDFTADLSLQAALLLFVGQAFIQVLMLMFLTDTIEYGQWKLGKRNEAITFSIQPLINKIGGALATGMVSISLVLSGIKTGDVAAEAIDASGKLVVKGAMFLLPLACIVIGYVIYRVRYKIDADFYEKIRKELESRN